MHWHKTRVARSHIFDAEMFSQQIWAKQFSYFERFEGSFCDGYFDTDELSTPDSDGRYFQNCLPNFHPLSIWLRSWGRTK